MSRMTEAYFRDAAAAALRDLGFAVDTERLMSGGGRADIVATNGIVTAIEVKGSQAITSLQMALGQALTYRNSHGVDNAAVVVPPANRGPSDGVLGAYLEAGVDLISYGDEGFGLVTYPPRANAFIERLVAS